MIYSFSPFDDGQINHANKTTKPQSIAKSIVASGTIRPRAHRPPIATARADMVTSAVRRLGFIATPYMTRADFKDSTVIGGKLNG